MGKLSEAGLFVAMAFIGVAVVAAQQAGVASQQPAETTQEKAWIAVSDGYTQQLLEVQLRHHPENGSAQGLAQFDPEIDTPTLERFTYRAPGQANSYFYGYTKLLGLRKDVEAALGHKFNALRFHDFVIAQGLLPPDLLRQAVMEEFVPAQK